jgi:hypothetical protein
MSPLTKAGLQLGVDSGQMAFIPVDPTSLKMTIKDENGADTTITAKDSGRWTPWLFSGVYGFGMVFDLGAAGTYPVTIGVVDLPHAGARVAYMALHLPEDELAEGETVVGHVTTPTGWLAAVDPCYFHSNERLGNPPYKVYWWGSGTETVDTKVASHGLKVVSDDTNRSHVDCEENLRAATDLIKSIKEMDLGDEKVVVDLQGVSIYSGCCDVTLSRHAGEYDAEIGRAVGSHTGFGDGVYWGELFHNLEGDFVGYTVTFIEMEEIYAILAEAEAEAEQQEEVVGEPLHTTALSLVDEIKQGVEDAKKDTE